ncbi:MAG: 50S ribosomal protein L18 [Bacillales bacterium]|nr:50S ribosomal protein L18 [Bacillales bacterium]
MIKTYDSNAQRIKRHARIRQNLCGTEARPRLDVFRSNANIYAQIINDESGKTIVEASSLNLENGGNIEAAKKVGADVAQKALAAGIKEIVFDRGGYIYHGRVKALAEAAREAGLKF